MAARGRRTARRGLWGVARIVSLITSVVVGLIVVGIVLVLLEANRDNAIVGWLLDAAAWLEAIPAQVVGEIHLAGHSLDSEGTLLIDSHDASVSEDVWRLYEGFVARIGPRPTLIERDGNVPPFMELMAERNRAQPTGCGRRQNAPDCFGHRLSL